MRSFVPTARRRAALARAAAQLVALAAMFSPALAQPQPPPGAAAGASAARHRPPPVRATPPKAEARPAWAELTPAQKTALEPLAGSWSQLAEAHKRKWLAVSDRYPTMPPGEQARLHTRMAEWAALSPQQRSQARLNFAETSKLPVTDRKAKWEAYQALSPEEKRKLAAGARAARPAAPLNATTPEPVPQDKLTKVPAKPRKEGARARRNAVVPAEVDRNTLLPPPGAIPVDP